MNKNNQTLTKFHQLTLNKAGNIVASKTGPRLRHRHIHTGMLYHGIPER
jgi:hypothetical protein